MPPATNTVYRLRWCDTMGSGMMCTGALGIAISIASSAYSPGWLWMFPKRWMVPAHRR